MKILSAPEVKNIFKFGPTVKKPISIPLGKSVKHDVQNFDLKFEIGRVLSDRNFSALVVPFRIIVRNTKLKIEDECANKYPELMDYIELDLGGLKRRREMDALIMRSLSREDMSGFVYHLVNKRYFNPFYINDKLIKCIHISIQEVTCKVFYEQRIPYLIVDASYVINIKKFFEEYDAKNLIKYTFNRSFTDLEIKARLIKDLPLIAHKINVTKFQAEFLIALRDRLYDKKSKLRADAIKWAGGDQKEFEKASLSTTWKGYREIVFKFDKLYSGFIGKMWKNKYKLIAAAVVYKNMKDKKRK